ncbi:MAG: TlpA disulfide reductase family protein [Bacteroidia bacterium]|nr:TlpA disulfide reductase family protein [Bacteroidia bacterium]
MSVRFFSAALLSLFSLTAFAQTENALPQVNVQDLRGSMVNTASWANDGKPIIISFWATWCKPCIKELANIHEVYGDWQEETGVKLIAVSIDDSRTSGMVRSMTLGRGWEYDIYLDVNSDLKRAMNVVNVPHTFLLDGEGRIVYQHTSYADGDEEELFRQILDLGQ